MRQRSLICRPPGVQAVRHRWFLISCVAMAPGRRTTTAARLVAGAAAAAALRQLWGSSFSSSDGAVHEAGSCFSQITGVHARGWLSSQGSQWHPEQQEQQLRRWRQQQQKQQIAGRDRVVRRAITVPRPIGGPRLTLKRPNQQPDGAERNGGPIRPLYFKDSVIKTLEAGTDLEGRAGLWGRYREQVRDHLDMLQSLREQDTPMDAYVYWDLDSFPMKKKWTLPHRELMSRVLTWIAGLVDMPVTRVESVEFTRYEATHQELYSSGKCNWRITLRQLGGVVHRAWPPMTFAVENIFLNRLRVLLDSFEAGEPKHMVVILSNEGHYDPMMEAAQSEGVTLFRLGTDGMGYYYPGGMDFSVKIAMREWWYIWPDFLMKKADVVFQEERPPDRGPRVYAPGVVALKPAQEEEQDCRTLHSWFKAGPVWPNRFEGKYVRPGTELNISFPTAIQKALTDGRRPLLPEAREAAERLLNERKQLLLPQERQRDELAVPTEPMTSLDFVADGTPATVYWNFETMPLMNEGPSQKEMLARVMRWLEGFLGVPVGRVEVSSFVQPWETLGNYGHDWLYNMQRLGMVVHRVWPPVPERANSALSHGILAQAREAESLGRVPEGKSKLVCILAEEMTFDGPIRSAQQVGITTIWLTDGTVGYVYPAHSNARFPISTVRWKTLRLELAEAARNPHIPGASRPDRPHPVAQEPTVPVNLNWGRPFELSLDSRGAALAEKSPTRREYFPRREPA